MGVFARTDANVSEPKQAELVSPDGPERAQKSPGQIDKLPEPATAGDKRQARIFLATAMGFAALGAAVYLTRDPARASWALWLIAMFLVSWAFVCAAAFTRSSPDFMGQATKFVVVFAPAVFVGVFVWGLRHGYRDLTLPGEAYSLVRNQPDARAPEKVNLLRTFERGILVRLPDQKVNEFLRWDQIRAIRLQRDGGGGK